MSQHEPPVHPHLDDWAAAARLAPRPDAMRRARAAMTLAVRSSAVAAATAPAGRGARLLAPLHLRRRLVLSVAAGLAAAAVLAVGWNAGPGSPLHTIQQVKEDTSLVMAGSSQAASLRLDYAESRLSSAAAGSDPTGNLAEATWLLDAVKVALPSNRADPLRQRWDRDEARLAGLDAAAATPAPGEGAPRSAPPASATPRPGRGQGGAGGTHDNGGDDRSPGPTPTASPSRGNSGAAGGQVSSGDSRGGSSQASASPQPGQP